MNLYDKLKEFSIKENIVSGVGNAEPFYELKEHLKNKEVPFVNFTVEERTEPRLIMENAKSIIAIGLSYNVVYRKINDGRLRGNMSAGAVGTDYHIVIMEKLEKLKDEILPDREVKMFADTGPLSDRDVALRCGLGTRGKNGSVINSEMGGMFFIGYMITDVEYELWHMEKGKAVFCGECDKCIKYCPNSAIIDGKCDYSRCISYITQKKGALSDEEYRAMGRQIYGCDICQRVCPYNRKFDVRENEYACPDIEMLMNMTNREFKEVYGNTAAGWRGRRTLQRNALAVLGNIKDKRGLEIALKYRESEFEDLRSAAEYAVRCIKES